MTTTRRTFLTTVGLACAPLLLAASRRSIASSREQGVESEGAAFYWFNSITISDAGHSLYGRYVYDAFLRLVAPGKLQGQKPWLVLCDGDCMTSAENLKGYFRDQDGALLDEAARVRESLCYVVAVIGEGRSRTAIDSDLRQVRVLGYMGMTAPRQYSRETFLNARQIMALVIAARIDGPVFKRISYDWHTDAQLRRLGFSLASG